MENLSLSALLIILIALVFVSAFFSGSETGVTTINRYRLRHLARSKHPAAMRVSILLERLDQLLGMILIGNTAANIFAASVATVIGFRTLGNYGATIAPIILTLVILVFAEITPKTLAANYPQRIAFFAALPLKWLLKLFYPLVWLLNSITNGLLRLSRFKAKRPMVEHLSSDELMTLVREAGGKIPDQYQAMLLAILELEKVTVNDIMIPRNDIVGIDLEDDWSTILKRLINNEHIYMPVYEGNINNVKGILHVRETMKLMVQEKLTRAKLLSLLKKEIYFIPESAHLHTQLLNFRALRRRVGLVVDEYGDILGMITLEDILEEIVGEFTTDISRAYKGVSAEPDGSYLVDGSINIRDLNRTMNWHFDTYGPKTLSGLIIEYLETIPKAHVCIRLSGYPLEVIKVSENMIKLVRVLPKYRR